jgi:cytochrome c-type biogenesis protein
MLVMNEKDIINGVILMILYSFGLGIPFIISAVLIDKLKTVFNFIKKNFKYVKIISGILLIISGLFLIFS